MKSMPAKTWKRIERYRDEPPMDKDHLRAMLQRGYKEFMASCQESEHADGPLGMRLYHAFELLLERDIPEEHWPMVQLAAHYLVDPEDAVDDVESDVGMMDDAEVFNDLCTALDFPELKVH